MIAAAVGVVVDLDGGLAKAEDLLELLVPPQKPVDRLRFGHVDLDGVPHDVAHQHVLEHGALYRRRVGLRCVAIPDAKVSQFAREDQHYVARRASNTLKLLRPLSGRPPAAP